MPTRMLTVPSWRGPVAGDPLVERLPRPEAEAGLGHQGDAHRRTATRPTSRPGRRAPQRAGRTAPGRAHRREVPASGPTAGRYPESRCLHHEPWTSDSSAAPTVTGCQFLLTRHGRRSSSTAGCSRAARTRRSATASRSRVDPATLDAILLTHAHLDHCGLIPVLVREGFRGRSAHGRHDRARPPRAPRLGAAPGGVREARARAASGATRRSRPERDARDPALRGGDRGAVAGAGAASRRAAADRRSVLRAAGPDRGAGPRRAALHRGRRRRRAAAAPPDPLRRRGGGRARESTPRSSTPATSWARRSSGCGSRRPAAGATGHRLLRRPRAARNADHPRPDRVTAADYRPVRVHLRRPRARAGRARRACSPRSSGRAPSGVLLVPSFAIGRTQELIWELDRLVAAGQIPALPLYLDSPMAKAASDIYRAHPEYYDEETRRSSRAATRRSTTRASTS